MNLRENYEFKKYLFLTTKIAKQKIEVYIPSKKTSNPVYFSLCHYYLFFVNPFQRKMKANEQEQYLQDESEDPQLTNDLNQQIFYFPRGKVRYLNKQERAYLKDNSSEHQFKVQNYLCRQEENKLKKVTEIIIKNQKLLIKDEYEICPCQTMQRNEELSYKETKIFIRRRNNYSQLGNTQKRDTKNLVKNILTLFNSWVKTNAENNLEYERSYAKMNEKLKSFKSYNKTFLYAIAEDSELRSHFRYFSKEYGEKMIEQSKIKDKNSHKMALNYYTKLFLKDSDKNKGNSNSSTRD